MKKYLDGDISKSKQEYASHRVQNLTLLSLCLLYSMCACTHACVHVCVCVGAHVIWKK